MRRTRLFSISVLVLLSGVTVSAQTAADPPVSAEPGVVDPAYGVASDSIVSISSRDFSVYEPGAGPTSDNGNGYRWMTAGSNKIFTASISVPTGVTLTRVGFNYCDVAPTSSFNVVLYDFSGDNGFTFVTSFTPPDRTGCGLALSPAITYQWDTQTTRNLMFYIFQQGTAVAGEVKFRGAEVHYRRKVSPAPLVATFPTDVPTTHPNFQFIEALVASGITSGCAPGSYCPDSPLTRQQMAVFLARALGLHFPN